MRAIWHLLWDRRGTTAVEVAIISPAFIALFVGLLNLCLFMFSATTLHYAVEEAARCASVLTGTCSDAASTKAYAASHYYGLATNVTFNYSTAACGNLVTANTTYDLNSGVHDFSIPLSASACFP